MATSGQSIVIGVFDDIASADRSLTALQQAGFNNDQIRYTMGKGDERSSPKGIKALFTGEKTTPHKNVMDDLINMGVEPQDAHIYQEEYEAGHPLVSVTGRGNMQEAINVLHSQGAHAPAGLARSGANYQTTDRPTGETRSRPAGETREARSRPADRTGSRVDETRTAGSRPAERGTTRSSEVSPTETTESQKMRLHAEQLKAHKQPEQIGEVDIHKEVVTEQQTINVPVTREEVVIERRSLAEDASAAERPIGEGEDIRIPIREEKVNISKEEVVTGEVEISKRRVQENRQFSDTVRHEEAHLENRGDVPIIDNERNQPPPSPQP